MRAFISTCAAVLCLLGWQRVGSATTFYYWTEAAPNLTKATYVYNYTVLVGPCSGGGTATRTFQTGLLQNGADTVMYELEFNTQIALNDDYKGLGLASRIDYTYACNGNSHLITIYVMAKSNLTGGNGDGKTFHFYDNGVDKGQHRLGGFSAVFNINTASTDTMETVLVNDGAQSTKLFRMCFVGNSYSIDAIDATNGVGIASKLPGATCTNERWVIGTTSESAREGFVRLVRNDAASGDTDNDGLGNGLETEACTCVTAGFFTCPINQQAYDCDQVNNMQDTDGDGLKDDWELVGVDDPTYPQSLSLWGASPRHKDIFVEYDKEYSSDPALDEPTAKAVADEFSRLNILNIDATTGISYHADIGGACASEPGDTDGISKVCGDFGGASIAPTYSGVCINNLNNYMAHVRLGKFHWVQRTSDTSQGNTPTPSDCTQVSASLGIDAAHDHLAHELGHQFGLQHYGEAFAGEANRKAAYPSLMNYAYGSTLDNTQNPVFSNGSLVPYPLDPANLSETTDYGGVAPIGFLTDPNTQYAFPVDPANPRHIDWNRDGFFDPSVRAHIQGQSQWHDYGGVDMPANVGQINIGGQVPSAGVGATYLASTGATYVISNVHTVNGNTLMYSFTYTPVLWSGWLPLDSSPTVRSDSGPSAVTYNVSGTDYMYVFVFDSTGQLRYGKFNGATLLGSWVTLSLPLNVVAHETSAVVLGSNLYVMVQDDASPNAGQLWLGQFSSGVWTGSWTRVNDSSNGNTPILSCDNVNCLTRLTPGLAAGPDGAVYMVARDPNAQQSFHKIWKYDPTTGLWAPALNVVPPGSGMGSCFPKGRIAAAFRYFTDANGTPLARGTGSIWWWYNAQCFDFGEVTETVYRWTWGPFTAATKSYTLGAWHRTPLGEDGACFSEENFGGVALVNRPDALSAFVPHVSCSTYTDQTSCEAVSCAWASGVCSSNHCASSGVLSVPHADGGVTPPHLLGDHDDVGFINANLCTALHSADCAAKCNNFAAQCAQAQQGETVVCDQADAP